MAKVNYKTLILILGLIAFSFLFVWYVFAWSEPLQNPPDCTAGDPGCDAPLNIGPDYQQKIGPLIVNTGGALTGLEVTGQIKITGGSPGAGMVLTSDAAGLASWQPGGGGAGNWTIGVLGDQLYANDTTWNVGIGTTDPNYSLHVVNPASTDNEMFFDSTKGAFRAGSATGSDRWDDVNIGEYSTALGEWTMASGLNSTAIGYGTIADGYASFAMGEFSETLGDQAIAMGLQAMASGTWQPVAIGAWVTASGARSATAIGRRLTASGTFSMVLGHGLEPGNLVNNIDNSLMIGFNSDIPTLFVGPSSGAGTTGNVGIGTTDPQARLSFYSPVNEDVVRFDGPGDAYAKMNHNFAGWLAKFSIQSLDDTSPDLLSRISVDAYEYVTLRQCDSVGGTSVDVYTNEVSIWYSPGSCSGGGRVFVVETDDGEVGIGADAPSAKLHIIRDGLWSNIEKTGHALELDSSYSSSGYMTLFMGPDNTNDVSYIQSALGGVGKRPLVLNPQGGNVGINTVDPQVRLHVSGGTGGVGFLVEADTDNVGEGDHPRITLSQDGGIVTGQLGYFNSTNILTLKNVYNDSLELGTNNLVRFRINSSGQVSGTFGDYHVSSDIRLKKDIATIPNALEKVLALRGVNFRWKDFNEDQSLQMGMIAQEVEKIVPELVHTANDEMQTKAVEYQYTVGLLIEAIKDLNAEIETLKAQLSTKR